jgi:hypothetical protein
MGVATTVTAAAGGLALVDRGVLPGRRLLLEAEGACDVGVPAPNTAPGLVTAGSFRSAARGTTVGYTVVHPPGAGTLSGLPTCIFLHGRGDPGAAVAGEAVGIPRRLAAYVASGGAPFAIVGVDGGASTYWHRRASGEDPGAMLTDELLPRLAALGLRTDRFGLLGVSMGGYGALLWGEALGSGRIAAVGALSPALWQDPGEAASGAFDSPADFAAHDVFAGRSRLARIPTRIDVGTGDPFAGACAAFLAGAPPSVTGSLRAGCHDAAFWGSVVGDHIARIGSELAHV